MLSCAMTAQLIDSKNIMIVIILIFLAICNVAKVIQIDDITKKISQVFVITAIDVQIIK